MLGNNRKSGIVLSYTSTALSMVCGLVISSFLLRTLGDFEYGLYHTIATFINYLIILEFGTGTVMRRNLLVARNTEDPDSQKKITATVWYITVFLSVVILLTGALFYANIGNIYSESIPQEHLGYAQHLFLVLLGYLLVSFFFQTLSGTFLGNENYNIGTLIHIINIACRTVILLIAVTVTESSMVIALTDAFLSLACLSFSIIYIRRKYVFSFNIKYFDKKILKISLPLCFALLLQAVITQANSSIATFIVSIKMNMESVALYSVAMYVHAMFSSLVTIPIPMYLPQIAKDIGNSLRGRALLETLVPSGRVVALVGGTVLFGFVSVGVQFIDIVYGEHYRAAWLIAVMIIVPVFISATGGSMINVLDVFNRRQMRSYILIVTTILNIFLILWSIERWGVYAAAAATAASMLIGQVLLLNFCFQRAFSMNLYVLYAKSYIGILPALLLATLVGGGVGLLITNKYLSFLCGGGAFVAVEALCLWWFGFNQSERTMVHSVMAKITGK